MTTERQARFITLDGPSAVGKTTVSQYLAKVLRERGHDPLTTATPSMSEIGRLARGGTHRIAGHTLSCLVAADRYQHHCTVVAPALADERTVICDRYVPSALVLDRVDGVSHSFVAALYGALPPPDLAFVLVGDPAVCAARAAARGAQYSRFHSCDVGQHERERHLFETAVTELHEWGYPVRRLEIGERNPLSVARMLADIVCSHRTEEDR